MSTAVPPAGAAGAVPQADVSAKKRFGWLAKRGTLWILALLLLVIALLVATFSFGLFTSSSANVGNTVTTGAMSLDNSKENAAIFDTTNNPMVPGDEVTGTVTLTNVGDAGANVVLTDEALVDTPGAGNGNLSEVLQLEIVDDPTGAADVVFAGAFDALGDVQLGSWSPDESHTYQFTVLFPDASDNAYQNSKVTVTYLWNATSE